jgi:hypothetical protein
VLVHRCLVLWAKYVNSHFYLETVSGLVSQKGEAGMRVLVDSKLGVR